MASRAKKFGVLRLGKLAKCGEGDQSIYFLALVYLHNVLDPAEKRAAARGRAGDPQGTRPHRVLHFEKLGRPANRSRAPEKRCTSLLHKNSVARVGEEQP